MKKKDKVFCAGNNFNDIYFEILYAAEKMPSVKLNAVYAFFCARADTKVEMPLLSRTIVKFSKTSVAYRAGLA
ncbi:MAG: hypothetical protein LBU33_03605 [Endomicrobium sp.]|nr:hypothetical protein [Endomicrobium sp.]